MATNFFQISICLCCFVLARFILGQKPILMRLDGRGKWEMKREREWPFRDFTSARHWPSTGGGGEEKEKAKGAKWGNGAHGMLCSKSSRCPRGQRTNFLGKPFSLNTPRNIPTKTWAQDWDLISGLVQHKANQSFFRVISGRANSIAVCQYCDYVIQISRIF